MYVYKSPVQYRDKDKKWKFYPYKKYKITEIIGCNIYKYWKTIEFLNSLGNMIHKEIDVLVNQWRDGQARFRSGTGQ